jgi:hypothetical protein
MDEVLRANAAVAEALSRKIAENKLRNESVFLSRNEQEREDSTAELSKSIFSKIRSFFKLA